VSRTAPGEDRRAAYRLAVGAPTATPTRGSDWDALGRGCVSITPIDADRTANLGFAGVGFLGSRW
jgi:hypothetical protein